MSNAQAVTTRKETAEVVSHDADSIMAVISRAASDPSTDVNKLERLLEMYERVSDRAAKSAYAAALADMQPDLPVIPERGEIRIGTGKPQRYALWEDINELIKPVLQQHGFAISFRTGRAEDKISVTGVLSHRAGHSEETTLLLPLDQSGSKNAVQAVGSSTSYGKRYTAAALLNLTSRGEDDDGVAGGSQTISTAQVQELTALADEVGADKAKFCDYMGVNSFAEISLRDFAKATTALNAKRKGAKS